MVKKRSAKTASMGLGIVIGVLIALSVTLLSAAGMAWLISTEKMHISNAPVIPAAVHLLSAFSGSWAAVLITKQQRLQITGAVAGTYFLLLLAVTVLAFGGEYKGFLWGLCATALGAAAPIFIGAKGKKRTSIHRKKGNYR